ncbi:uncharacterized protein EDB93DRAFT_1131124 [Suillus bovinus]|uniref:uncharacterized protein n=1 Tax=Suillus bovinus TaxID=48563 RepID=UPI001B87EC1C|nr:uncharacterized protein EDB93DRAFT_1131124 [Suillus bovinus]KAG2155077.1 hypothetical protein EDB93DRAFT_1131124 [Suillus bovinus]
MIGPVVLGALVNACLFGGLAIQTHVYYANFPKDHRGMKLTVAAILASQIAHVICVSATLWKVAVSGYGNPLTLSIFPLGADAAILFTAITGALVESSFAFRLWKLSKSLTLPLISLALCLLAQSIALTMTVKAFTMTDLLTFETDENRLITLSLTSRLVCELTLTLSMVWYLRKQRSSTFASTTTIIDRLVLWTLETGIITSLVVVFIMSFFLAMKHNYIWVGLYANLATVNANSLLASLNGRLILRSVPNQSVNMNTPSSLAGGRSRETQSLVIDVTQTVETATDVVKYYQSEI